ncbi:endonuclease/exonuclease/phosphatase family protein [uncultured Bacteroides sp.]|uniref:endonuclease/exonuclease/phosphatase family protein n=1 Tax=uncultured Bacteroides sp. TaxID=162156 RepID=UPI002AA7034B|nr:endonuclease/exonuclease/phosphatase family protein [uncultured Bacteroides sp.]
MKKQFYLLFSLFVLITLTGLKAQKQQSVTINVVSFNLRMDTPDDKENAWSNRKEMVKELLLFHDADIVGTQEGFLHQLQDIASTGVYNYVGVGRDDGKEAGEHSAIFYKKDRFDILEQGNFWLSQTPEEPSYGWDAKIRRICTWAKMRDRSSDKTFYCFNVHYDHQAPIARLESSKLMLSRIKSIAGDAPVICTGDFNATPTDEPIAYILNDGFLKDSRALSVTPPYGPEGTFQGFHLDSPMENRIDYAFVAHGISVLKYGVLTDIRYGRFPSDHCPVFVKLAL